MTDPPPTKSRRRPSRVTIRPVVLRDGEPGTGSFAAIGEHTVAFVSTESAGYEALDEAFKKSLLVGRVEHFKSLVRARAAAADGGLSAVFADLSDKAGCEALSRQWTAPVPLIGIAEELDLGTQLKAQALGLFELVAKADLTPALAELLVRWSRELLHLRRELDNSRLRLSLAAEASRDGLWEWDLGTDKAVFSRRWKSALGYEDQDIGETISDWVRLVHPEDRPRLENSLAELRQRSTAPLELDVRMKVKDGTFRWMSCRAAVMRDETGHPTRMAGSLTDISDYRANLESIRASSRHDPVTHLPKRGILLERLARALELARAHPDYAFGALLVEIDRFQHLVDTMGADAGKQLLMSFASRLQKIIDSEHTVAILDGARFSVLLDGLDEPGQTTTYADEVLRLAESPFMVDEEAVYLNLRIGLTTSDREYNSPDQVLADIGAAAASADGHGGGAARRKFSTEMRIEAVSLLRMEMALRKALEDGQLYLEYQPILDLKTTEVCGFEALMRWKHPTRGVVSPGEFIPVAEETGLIGPMGRWALDEAVNQLATWRAGDLTKEFYVSVNVSGRQLDEPDWPLSVLKTLRKYKVEGKALALELTESELVEHAGAASVLAPLRAQGIRVLLDDFGTGYSSLSLLDRVPLDGLKIDRSFVDVLDGSEQTSVMVRAIISLAENLSLDVIAEGVETKTHQQALIELGAKRAQGFLFCRPVAAAEAQRILRNGIP